MLPLIHPAPLKHGSRVAILSPAGPVLEDHLQQGLEQLRVWGLEPVVLEQALARSSTRGYLAGADNERLEALEHAFYREDIDAILCARGGYGAMRLLETLDPEKLRAHAKLLVGFSDITALHLYMVHNARISSLHGPVLKSFRLHHEPEDRSLDHLRAALFGERGSFKLEGLKTVRKGSHTGPLIGGNLSLVQSMLASPYAPDLTGAILFLEDVTEPDYRLDRLLTSVRLARGADKLGGLALGDFNGCGGVYIDDEDIPAFLESIASEFSCPTVMGLPVGHTAPNIALPLGVSATLDATEGILTMHHDAVRSVDDLEREAE